MCVCVYKKTFGVWVVFASNSAFVHFHEDRIASIALKHGSMAVHPCEMRACRLGYSLPVLLYGSQLIPPLAGYTETANLNDI